VSAFELVGLTKAGGPLTKRISLAADGSLRSDGSACKMAEGHAYRLEFDSLAAFAQYIGACEPHQAIALGTLHPDLPDNVRVITKETLNKLNGRRHLPNDLIARTADYISYRPGQLALALLDLDTKDIPAHVRKKISALGGYSAVLFSVLPELQKAGLVVRRSTSAGLRRIDTGEALVGSDGRHVFVLISDGTDARRFLQCLHDRLWLAGCGWLRSMTRRCGRCCRRGRRARSRWRRWRGSWRT